jgi:A/G-specific adenine glycosylase
VPDLSDLQASDDEKAHFREDLLDWYDDHKRQMPWRETDDPYAIWVSEIMLQQTRVDTVRAYYRRFLEAFPTVEDLAAADRDEVLKLWEGLGYYSRARYLHEAAAQVVEEHDGQVPETMDAIRDLKGIGPYTAAAVLSIAYQKPHAVLDGNVARLLTRIYAVDDDSTSSTTKRHLRRLANELLNRERPADFNQAMMELGSTVCTPTSPDCDACPVSTVCRAHAEGDEERYPITPDAKPVPHYDIAVALIFDDDGRLLIQRRPDEGQLAGLWEFPGGKYEEDADDSMEAACRREIREELGVDIDIEEPFYTLKHAYTHFKITLHAFRCRITDGAPTAREDQPMTWVTLDELDDYAFPRANGKLIEELHRRQEEPSLFD